MDSPMLDDTQTRAICDEIGERLRILLKSTTPDNDNERDFDEKLQELFGDLHPFDTD